MLSRSYAAYFSCWRCKGSLDRPSECVEAVNYAQGRDSCFKSPILDNHMFAAKFYDMIASIVCILFFACSPFTITRFIVSVVVFALDTHSFRRFAHVSKKVCELFPSGTNANSAPSVVFVAGCLGIVTPIPHGTPTMKGSGAAFPVRFVRADKFSSPAPAAFCVTSAQAVRSGSDNRAAITSTNPCGMLALAVLFDSRVFQHHKSMKALTHKIYKFWHSGITYSTNTGVMYTVA